MKTELNTYSLLELEIVEVESDVITQSGGTYGGFYGTDIDLVYGTTTNGSIGQ